MSRVLSKIKNIFKVIIIVTFIIDFVICLYMPESIITSNTVIRIILAFIISFIYNLCRYAFVFGIYFAIKLAKGKVHLERLSKEDFINNGTYYRNIIDNYNTLELSYIDNFKLNNPKDLVAILLLLKEKGFIKLNENRIEVINKNTNSPLECYIISTIVNGKFRINMLDIKYLNNLVINSAVEKDLIKKDPKKFSFIKLFKWLFIGGTIYSLIYYSLENIMFDYSNIALSFIVVLLLVICPIIGFFSVIYIIAYYIYKSKNPYIRTEKGNEINKKLEGLKNYLKDFSSINEKNVEDIIIWDEYLIYSVLFNQNTKVVKEVYQKYFE